MIKELTYDFEDYAVGGSIFKRRAARGIIQRKGKYLAIHGKYGDCKFPGGGVEEGEQLIDTLLREVQEETGYRVIPESIREVLLVHEKRKGNPEDVLEMDSWYYFCEVEEKTGKRSLDDYEEEYGYETAWLTLEEMIEKNESVTNCDKVPWVRRDTMVMKELQHIEQDFIEKGGF